MKRDRLVAPGKRRRRASSRPSRAESAFPLGDYMLKPSDPLGRSVMMSTSMPPDARRVASVILAKGLFGFCNEQDISRWCLHYGLNELDRRAKDTDITASIVQLNAWAEACATEMEHLIYEKKFGVIEKSLYRLIETGHVDKAEQLAERIWQELDRFDDPHWRPRFRRLAKDCLDRVRKEREKGIEAGGGSERRRESRRERER